jgi:hypothetical protein
MITALQLSGYTDFLASNTYLVLDDGAIIQWPPVITLWLWIFFARQRRRPDPAWRALRGATLRRGIYPYPGGFDAS